MFPQLWLRREEDNRRAPNKMAMVRYQGIPEEVLADPVVQAALVENRAFVQASLAH